MERLLEFYSSSWEILNFANGFTFNDLKLTFPANSRCFTVNLFEVLNVLRVNGYRCPRPSTALIESAIIDCYKRHIASGGEIIPEGERIQKSDRMASYVEAVPPPRHLMH